MYLLGLNNYRVIRIRINQECNSRSRQLRNKKDQYKPRIYLLDLDNYGVRRIKDKPRKYLLGLDNYGVRMISINQECIF